MDLQISINPLVQHIEILIPHVYLPYNDLTRLSVHGLHVGRTQVGLKNIIIQSGIQKKNLIYFLPGALTININGEYRRKPISCTKCFFSPFLRNESDIFLRKKRSMVRVFGIR